MALEKPGKLGFFSYFVATLYQLTCQGDRKGIRPVKT